MVSTTTELALRRAIIDALCLDPDYHIGKALRAGLREAQPGPHPEDACEECCAEFAPWMAEPEDWETVTGRSWGGPILCESCFCRRLRARKARAER